MSSCESSIGPTDGAALAIRHNIVFRRSYRLLRFYVLGDGRPVRTFLHLLIWNWNGIRLLFCLLRDRLREAFILCGDNVLGRLLRSRQRDSAHQVGLHGFTRCAATPVLTMRAAEDPHDDRNNGQQGMQSGGEHDLSAPFVPFFKDARLQHFLERQYLYFLPCCNGSVTMLTLEIPVAFTASITVAKAPKGTFWSART